MHSLKRKTLPDQEWLRESLHYDAHTGLFYWKSGRTGKTKAGDIAGKMGGDGYIYIRVKKTTYVAHRLAFVWMTGDCPEYVDHVDGMKYNNRWENLREATRSQNNSNIQVRKDNTSGYKGVSWRKRERKFQAKVSHKGYLQHLGYFTCPIEAAKAYDRAALELHGEFARTNFPKSTYEVTS